MKIIFSPQRRDSALDVAIRGDVIEINGEAFDFSPLPDDHSVPVESTWFSGPVARQGGVLLVPLFYPHGVLPDGVVPGVVEIVAQAGPVEVPHVD